MNDLPCIALAMYSKQWLKKLEPAAKLSNDQVLPILNRIAHTGLHYSRYCSCRHVVEQENIGNLLSPAPKTRKPGLKFVFVMLLVIEGLFVVEL